MRRASWRSFQNLRSKSALRYGSSAGSMWFKPMGTTSKDSTVRMTKNSTKAEIWTQVGYFSDTTRIYLRFLHYNLVLCCNCNTQTSSLFSVNLSNYICTYINTNVSLRHHLYQASRAPFWFSWCRFSNAVPKWSITISVLMRCFWD